MLYVFEMIFPICNEKIESEGNNTMSGYIIKITIERTRPQVWRRVVIPEQISFYHLHQIIQTVFGWEDIHLHDFTFPNENFCVALPQVEKGSHILPEKDTVADEFLGIFKKFYYTYDFTNGWKHKIIFEKEDVSYDKRYAAVITAKGKNFQEDKEDGGGKQPSSTEYSIEEVNEKLKCMRFRKIKGTEKAKKVMQERGMLKKFDKIVDSLATKTRR